ncbi:MAG: 50S ribosomal protein L21 [Candidatus Peribacteraceae bacterium]|nr:50S ribosomal protein L21 [Candidatus Peribacteraceae bacterium]
MFAIVDIAGTQERVEEGVKLKVPLQDSETGNKVSFANVLLIVDGAAVTLGKPYVEGASVEATVLQHGKGDKIRVQKAHRRKRYRRVHGHRQQFTEIEITKIVR